MAHEKRKRTSSFNFNEDMRLMHKHDPQLREEGFGMLSAHAHEYVDRLMAEFQAENEHGLRCWLLELIGDARSPETLPLLIECLYCDDESFRWWAARGHKELDTKEARRALWEAGAHTHDPQA